MKKTNYVQLSQLVDMYSPAAVLEEVKYNFIQYYPIQEFFRVRLAFRDFLDFYEGRYPGYKACNTKFHDRTHITDSLLAISRLIDGYNIKNKAKLPCKSVVAALLATIFHDSGYIQTLDDKKGTGAKYTLTHVKRSSDFMRRYAREMGYSERDALAAGNMICCSGIMPNIKSIKFSNKAEKILGCMLGSADILGQMASRNYLEKLIFLYSEYKEGGVKGYASELDLFQKTFNFYYEVQYKLKKILGGVDQYAVYHFKKRYRIDANIYKIAVDEQMNYLRKILVSKNKNYKSMLKRQAY